MIVVTIQHVSETEAPLELAKIKFESAGSEDGTNSEYSARAVFKVGPTSVRITNRFLYKFPRTRINILGLLKAFLDQFEEEDLGLDEPLSSDMAWRQYGTLPEIQARGEADKLDPHGPAFWRGQSV